MKTSEILFSRVNKENQKVLEELKEKLKKAEEGANWMLCLGAGVSISVGLPDWYKLLAKITAQLLPMPGSCGSNVSAYFKDVEQFYKEITYDQTFLDKMDASLKGEYRATFENINVLEAAEYIRNFIEWSLRYPGEGIDEDERCLRERIDSHMNFLIQQACIKEMNINPSNDAIQKKTLAAVARLMKSEKDHLIHNAITYNYDNLLETYLREICGCRDERVHSIVKRDELRDFGDQMDWNIYHVHGRIPVVPYPGEEMSESVILTESDYYQEEQINYSWINILQSYAMLRANLIFIGFSGTDYNFRRIIKYVSQENAMPHERFIFFSVNDIVNAVFSKELKLGKKIEDCIKIMQETSSQYSFEKLFINYLINAQSVYWEKHGLKVIWSSHEQLYDDLEFLHS